ncbi:hypothetical protein [Spirosoma utsteinense]|uniref:Uncharacterized protein n=1 Tax=Spirosoma utsteinense TaxID=2585773 RepID=A0ABR6W567_9BACT|nr:hypothetical protein [Spirosoma utsteinense]MBC3784836.1 hypothetical protein [Spirosoma utsteinense]MBC3791126.1 hypothetical protein [Spirosoma utsteinense]
MKKELSWTKEAFSREVVLVEAGQPVGGMQGRAFSADVDAYLYDVRLRFDVTGFLIHSVSIHDTKADDRIVGTITLRFGKRAELALESGETYTWKRHNMLMREWDMIREGVSDADDKETINYSLTRSFFAEHGDISVEDDSSNASIVVLTGLFIRNYFQRRRRVAAAGGALAAGA